MVPIVRAFNIPTATRITFIMGSQMGKSLSMQNLIGARLDDDPAPIIYVGPTQSNIDSVVEPKIVEMFKGAPSLWDKLAKGQKSTKHHKRVAGVSLRLAWAGSATELASDSAALGLVDEVDRMDQDVKGEGSPVELTEARTSVYPDGKIGITSTPTEGTVEAEEDPRTAISHWNVSENVTSPVWRLWQEGSRHEWSVPCPSCKEYFVPRMSLLWWPEGSSPHKAEGEARLACPHCGDLLTDNKKPWMNSHGVMVAPGQKPAACDRDDGVEIQDFENEVTEFVKFGDFLPTPGSNMSFWVSGIMSFSAKKTFGFLAGKFLRAVKSGEPERIKGVINTDFGELYRVTGDAPDWQEVMECTADYVLGDMPEEVERLTAGVDVQKNRLVYVVRGWGEGNTSWLVGRGELWGDTDQEDVWGRLGDLLEQDYGDLMITKMAVDSGYRPDWVYEFCRKHKALTYATKGHDSLDKPYYASLIDVTFRGKTRKQGLQLWHVNADIFKSWVHSKIEWERDQLGAWYLPSDIDEDYCKQIVAEQRVVKPSGKIEWIKVMNDNHYLDAEALAYFALRAAGVTGGARKKQEGPKQPIPDEKHSEQSNSWVRKGGSNWLKRR